MEYNVLVKVCSSYIHNQICVFYTILTKRSLNKKKKICFDVGDRKLQNIPTKKDPNSQKDNMMSWVKHVMSSTRDHFDNHNQIII